MSRLLDSRGAECKGAKHAKIHVSVPRDGGGGDRQWVLRARGGGLVSLVSFGGEDVTAAAAGADVESRHYSSADVTAISKGEVMFAAAPSL